VHWVWAPPGTATQTLTPQVTDPDNAPLLKIPQARQGRTGQPNPDLRRVQDHTWPPDLSFGEKIALQAYSNEAFTVLNGALRTSDTVPPAYAKLHDRIQSAFRKARPFRTPVVVVRGVEIKGQPLEDLLAALARARHGETFALKGYISTSVGKQLLFPGNVEFHIQAVHGLDLVPVSLFPEERELLLNHNSRFRLTRHRKDGDKHIIECAQVPPRKRPAVTAMQARRRLSAVGPVGASW
jgi:hypothetical protein